MTSGEDPLGGARLLQLTKTLDPRAQTHKNSIHAFWGSRETNVYTRELPQMSVSLPCSLHLLFVALQKEQTIKPETRTRTQFLAVLWD